MKQRRAGLKVIGQKSGGSRVVFALFNLIFTGSAQAVIFVSAHRRLPQVSHIAKIFILHFRQIEQQVIFVLDQRYLTNGCKATGLFPTRAFVFKPRAFKAGSAGDFALLSGLQQFIWPFEPDFDDVSAALLFQQRQQFTAEKSAIGAYRDFPNPFRKPREALFHEFDTAIGGIGRAAPKLIVQTFTGFSDKAQQGVIAVLPFLLGIAASLSPLLSAKYTAHGRIHVQGDFAKPLFAPNFAACNVFSLRQQVAGAV